MLRELYRGTSAGAAPKREPDMEKPLEEVPFPEAALHEQKMLNKNHELRHKTGSAAAKKRELGDVGL